MDKLKYPRVYYMFILILSVNVICVNKLDIANLIFGKSYTYLI